MTRSDYYNYLCNIKLMENLCTKSMTYLSFSSALTTSTDDETSSYLSFFYPHNFGIFECRPQTGYGMGKIPWGRGQMDRMMVGKRIGPEKGQRQKQRCGKEEDSYWEGHIWSGVGDRFQIPWKKVKYQFWRAEGGNKVKAICRKLP